MCSINEEQRGNLDFTSAITPMCKALEVELAKYLYTGYINYLIEHKIPASDFKYERFFIVKDGAYTYKYRNPNDTRKFTLGTLGDIIGLHEEVQSTEISSQTTEDTEKSYKRFETSSSEKGETIIRRTIDAPLLAYAKELFSSSAFSKDNQDQAITDYLISLKRFAEQIKDTFRNPAAHSDAMSWKKSEACANHLIKKNKVLRDFIEKLDPEYIKKLNPKASADQPAASDEPEAEKPTAPSSESDE